MKKLIHFLLPVLLLCFNIQAQEITETNSDIVFQKALKAYKDSQFEDALKLTQHGLFLAPEYHDIRILEIRILWALNNFEAADTHLKYLLEETPEYPGVKTLVHQRLNLYKTASEKLTFIDQMEQVFPKELQLQVTKAQIYLNNQQQKEARSIAIAYISVPHITGAQRYAFQTILNQTVTDEAGVSYQTIRFSDNYSRNNWTNVTAEYQHNFNNTAVIGRINYADRSYDHGYLYELEAYPVFNEKWYAYTNIGFSDGTLFPDFRSSVSVHHNFAKVFEAEAGGRLLHYGTKDFFTGILGLSIYEGRFLLNARTFLGPKRIGKLIQNYQANVRYYLKSPENYLLFRLGTGISPDERNMFQQVQENPGLEAFYANAGIRHQFWNHHIFQMEAGYLFEELELEKTGKQFIGTIGYKFRF